MASRSSQSRLPERDKGRRPLGESMRSCSTGPAITKAMTTSSVETHELATGGQTALVTARAYIPPRLPTLTAIRLWRYQFGTVATCCQHGKLYEATQETLIYSRENYSGPSEYTCRCRTFHDHAGSPRPTPWIFATRTHGFESPSRPLTRHALCICCDGGFTAIGPRRKRPPIRPTR